MIFQNAVILLGLAMCATSGPAQPDPQHDEAWKKYKEEHGKKYEPSKEMERRTIWENNLARFEKHNAEAEKGLHSYKLGVNQFADMTKEEIRAIPPCYLPQKYNPSESEDTPEILQNMEDIPASWDWRKEGLVTAVGNQGNCGSCYAFATVGTLEGYHKKKGHNLVKLSEQNIVDCSWKYGNLGCGGGNFSASLKYVIKNEGIDTEKSYPYEGYDSHQCKYTEKGKAADCTGYKRVPKDEKLLATGLVNNCPLAVAMCATDQFVSYHGGIYDDPKCCEKVHKQEVNHAVLLVGYGSEKGKDYWIVKNSWGKAWGIDGYFHILRHKNVCKFGTDATYPVGEGTDATYPVGEGADATYPVSEGTDATYPEGEGTDKDTDEK